MDSGLIISRRNHAFKGVIWPLTIAGFSPLVFVGLQFLFGRCGLLRNRSLIHLLEIRQGNGQEVLGLHSMSATNTEKLPADKSLLFS